MDCMVNVLPNMVFETKIEQPKTAVSLENITTNISCENDMEPTSPIGLATITMQFLLLYFTLF